MFKRIVKELIHHGPFTALGGISGIIFLIIFHNISESVSYNLFYIAHPLHVLFSAIVTSSLYRIYQKKDSNFFKSFIKVLLVGYVGAVGISTISDSLFPYLGETLLNLPLREVHLGFIEKPILVNGVAILGVVFGFFIPITRLPHAMHVFLSTFASLFHVLMAIGKDVSIFIYAAIFLLLFISVWAPCCFSDIVFPMLFVKNNK